MSIKGAEKRKKQVRIYRICYINLLIYHFWFFSLVPVDLSYHLLSLLYSNTALLPPTFSVLLLANIWHFYVLQVQQYNYVHILFYNCF